MRVLFVCLGNFCRSPTAEAVMRALAARIGGVGALQVDSAGTAAYHVGEASDRRSVAAAARRGVALERARPAGGGGGLRALDLLVAMDRANRDELVALAPGEPGAAKVRLLREYDPAAVAAGSLDVPDPYYGGPSGFDDVLDVVTAACRGLSSRAPSRPPRLTPSVTLPAAIARGWPTPAPCRHPARRDGGGDINDAFAVTRATARAFVKTRADAPRGEFAAEATGLALARGARRAPVPAVVALGDPPTDAAEARLAGPGVGGRRTAGRGGRRAARARPGRAARGGRAGLRSDPRRAPAAADGGPAPLRIGPLVLDNDPRRTGRRSTPSGACARSSAGP